MRSVEWTETADTCAGLLTPEQRRAVICIVAHAQIDPTPDNLAKFTLYELGTMYTIHRDHLGHWAVYHIDHRGVLVVVAVGVGGPYVPLPRSD